jgi:hypothetical protein
VAAPVGFVGRERELSRLRVLVGGGDARLLLVLGDAGVGKTRLVTEGMRRVAADGAVAVWGGCLPMRETLPLLPVADALSELSRVDGGELLDAALAVTPGYVRSEVERLLPQVASDTAESSRQAESGQRERLFAAIAELLGAVAQRRRVVLVVEDVHWADAATLDCLTFLTRARRDAALPVVVTCRSDEAPLDAHVVEWLMQVRGRGGVAELRLGPLSRDEVAEQVAEIAGSPVPELRHPRLRHPPNQRRPVQTRDHPLPQALHRPPGLPRHTRRPRPTNERQTATQPHLTIYRTIARHSLCPSFTTLSCERRRVRVALPGRSSTSLRGGTRRVAAIAARLSTSC